MIIGNLGKDPVLGYNTSGRAKCSLSVAVTERYKSANGEQKENTTWFNVVFWGNMADTIKALDLHKGTSVFVAGKMTFRTYQDQDGQNRFVAELVGENLQILTPKSNSTPNPNAIPWE
jgi:single-strand DNA-binding protein